MGTWMGVICDCNKLVSNSFNKDEMLIDLGIHYDNNFNCINEAYKDLDFNPNC